MVFKRIFKVLMMLAILPYMAISQQSKSDLESYIDANLPSGSRITASELRTVLKELVNSDYNITDDNLMLFQFSEDGAVWHDDYSASDRYVRFSPTGVTWSGRVIILDNMNLDLDTNRITNVAPAQDDYDAVNLKQFLDSLSSVAVSETDPVYSGDPAAGITSGDTTNWNTAYGWGDHSAAGYLTSVPSLSSVLGQGNTTNGNTLLFDYDNGVAAQFKFNNRSFKFEEISSNALSVSYGVYGTVHSEMFKWDIDGSTYIKTPLIGYNTKETAGVIRFNTNKFEGYNGSSWVRLDSISSGSGGDMYKSTYDIDDDGDIDVNAGGTNIDWYAVGDLLYASGHQTLSKLSAGTNGYVLTSNGAGVAPSWQAASGSSLWNDTDPDGIYYTDGNVSIGTSTVTSGYLLRVQKDLDGGYAAWFDNGSTSGNGVIIQGGNGSTEYALRVDQESGASNLFNVMGDGSVDFKKYGVGSFVWDVPVYLLGVDASGDVGELNMSVETLSGTTPTWDMHDGLSAKITLTGNTTITLNYVPTGYSGNLTVTNASTAYNITFSLSGSTVKISPFLNSSGGAITMSGGSKIDVLSWYYDGTYFIVNGTLDYD